MTQPSGVITLRALLARAVARAIDTLGADAPADLLAWRGTVDEFATRGAGTSGRKRKEVEAVNGYEAALVHAFERWADDAVTQLADAPVDERDDLLAELLVALLAMLKALGVKHLPDAVSLGLNGASGSVALFERLGRAVAENDQYLSQSLIPAIAQRLREALDDDEIPPTADERKRRWLIALLPFGARVSLYAGAWWILYQIGVGDRGGGVKAFLDPLAHHCSECPQFQSDGGTDYASMDDYLAATGGRVPGEFECQGRCRCWLEEGGDVA